MVSKQKIMIVDDDNNIAELISLYLTKECFECKIVNDGEEALSAFPSFQPNLILLDLMLPGMDGYQVCREIRHKSNVPIIMLSAKGEVFDKVLGLELGADDYMINLRFQRTGSPGQSGSPPFPACPFRSVGTCRKIRGISGSDHQSDQLFRYLSGDDYRHAAKGTGTSVFSCFLT